MKTLHLQKTAVTAAGLIYLEGMTEIGELALPVVPLSDADLAHLAGMTKLSGLFLEGERITNARLVHLGRMTRMEQLSLRNTEVTSLDGIRFMTRLRDLDLTGSPIDDLALEPVARFSNLVRLGLGRTRAIGPP